MSPSAAAKPNSQDQNQHQTTDPPLPLTNDPLTHFKSLPLAQSTLTNPSFTLITSPSRSPTHNGQGHTLMGSTFNTPDTISHCLSFYREAEVKTSSDDDDQTGTPAEFRRLYTLGTALNAHASLLHGGVTACLLDSVMSNAAGLAVRNAAVDVDGTASTDTVVTVQLSIRYHKPIRTPGSVMGRSWVVRMEGRKIWVEGRIVGGVDGEVVHAVGEGVWLRVGSGKL